jgi:MFS transporter, DHA2 family, multidrug resistance protein
MAPPKGPHDPIRWVTLGVLCMSLMIISVDSTILNVALPTLARDLHASTSDLQWIVDAYVLVFAGLLLVGGSLGDRFGRRGVLSIGLVIFGASSAAAAFTSDPAQLIACRAVMGAGAALIMPATLSILINVFTEPKERGRAIGIWGGFSAIGLVVGPIAGGILLEHFWWGSVFLVNVPITAAAVVLGRLFVPTSRDPSNPKLDPVGALLSIVGLALLLWSIIGAPDRGWGDPATLLGVVISVGTLAAFALWERHSDHPMLDVRFFQNPRFTAASLAVTSAFFAISGSLFLVTQLLQSVMGYDALEAGVRLVPFALVIGIGAPLSPRLVERIGTKIVAAGGLFVMVGAMFLFTTVSVDSTYLVIFAALVVLASGIALTMPTSTESIMGSLPRAKAGVGSAVNDATRQTGGALAIAVMGSVLSWGYQSHLDAVPGVKAPVLASARESVATAVQAGGRLGGVAGTRLVDEAQQAFVSGFRLSFVVAACVLFGGALVALFYLPARAPDHHLNATEYLPSAMVIDDDELAPEPAPASVPD